MSNPGKRAKRKNQTLTSFAYRCLERRLLYSALFALLVGFAGIFIVRLHRSLPVAYEDALLIPALFAGFMLVHLIFVGVRFRGEQILVACMFLLMGLGVVLQFRYGFLNHRAFGDWHYIGYPVGLAAFLILTLALRSGFAGVLRKTYPVAFPLILAIQLYLLKFGVKFRGAKFAPGNMTPSELLKPLFLWLIVGFITEFNDELSGSNGLLPRPRLRAVVLMIVLILFPMSLIVFLRDIGLLSILVLLFVVVLYLATRCYGYLIAATLACSAGAVILSRYMDYWRGRFSAWLDPFAVATDQGYQTIQAYIALFAGGVIGRGLGEGNPERIPIVETDFVYAGLGEELGFLGSLVIIFVFAVFFHRGIRIGMRLDEPFPALLATGAILLIAIQTVINIGGVVNLLPITGITLPFISKGGSSLVTTLMLMGIVIGLSEDRSR